MLPEDGAVGLASQVSFSWIPVEGAAQYFFKIWKEGEEAPTLPTLITDQNTVTYATAPETTYNWQVFSVAPTCSTPSLIQSFTTDNFVLPDLIVHNIQLPNEPFSGQSIEVSWTVQNQTDEETGMVNWFDYIYLSSDDVFQKDIDLSLIHI